MEGSDAVARVVLSVDPGRSKCGLAVVSGLPARTLLSEVVATESLVVAIGEAARKFPKIETIIIGDGTKCHVLKRAIAEMFPGLPIALVDERNSSRRARSIYVTREELRGWQRLLPVGLRVPDRPIDNIVAELLAKDFLESFIK